MLTQLLASAFFAIIRATLWLSCTTSGFKKKLLLFFVNSSTVSHLKAERTLEWMPALGLKFFCCWCVLKSLSLQLDISDTLCRRYKETHLFSLTILWVFPLNVCCCLMTHSTFVWFISSDLSDGIFPFIITLYIPNCSSQNLLFGLFGLDVYEDRYKGSLRCGFCVIIF